MRRREEGNGQRTRRRSASEVRYPGRQRGRYAAHSLVRTPRSFGTSRPDHGRAPGQERGLSGRTRWAGHDRRVVRRQRVGHAICDPVSRLDAVGSRGVAASRRRTRVSRADCAAGAATTCHRAAGAWVDDARPRRCSVERGRRVGRGRGRGCRQAATGEAKDKDRRGYKPGWTCWQTPTGTRRTH